MIFIITGYQYVVALTSYNAVKILLLLKYIVTEFIKPHLYFLVYPQKARYQTNKKRLTEMQTMV